VGVETTGKDEITVSVGTLAGKDGVESAVLFPPQADKRSPRQIQMDTEISFLRFSVSISILSRIA